MRVLLALVVALALVAPALGAAFDHHFAERNPAHSHLSERAAIAGHVHDPSKPHEHAGLAQPGLRSEAALISQDMGAESAGPLPLVPCDCGLTLLLSAPASGLLPAGIRPEIHTAEADLSPPDQPPRA